MASGTVDPAVGNRMSIAFKKENTWGDFATGTNDYSFLPQTGNDINGTIELLDNPQITSGRFQEAAIASSDTIEGSVDYVIDPDKFGYQLYYLLGDINESGTASGTGAYNHGFFGNDLANSSASLPSFSIFRDVDKFNQLLTGAKVDTLSIDQGESEVLVGSTDIVARKEEEHPSGTEPTVNVPSVDPLVYREASLELDLGDGGGFNSVGNVVDISVDITNNLESEFTINSGKWIGVLVSLQREITGTMTFKYDDNSIYDAYLNDNDLQLKVTWDSGVTAGSSTGENRKLFMYLPLVKLDTVPISVGGGDEIVTQDIDFSAYNDPNASQSLPDGSTLSGFDIYFELTNETTTGTYQN